MQSRGSAKVVRSIGLLLVSLWTMASVGMAQDDAIKGKIVALEKAWNQAYKSGDTRALGDLLDDNIVLINDDGSTQTKKEFLDSVKPSNKEEQVSPESLTVHVFGETAIATGVFRATGTEGGKHYVRRERFVDTWVLKNGKWVCVATNATPILH